MKRTALLIAIAALACHRAEKPAAPATTSSAGGGMTTTAAPAPAPAPQPQPQPESSGPPTNVGDSMPAYTAKLLDGGPFSTATEKGNVVLLNVWATWCGPCKFEIPELQKLHDQYAKRGFKVVGVSVDEGDVKEVQQFVAAQKMTYPIALDPDQRIVSVLQTGVLPTTVLFDRNGKIVWRHVGAIPGDDSKLASAINAALK